MRYAGFVAAALIILSCGPDPNATLPHIAGIEKGGSGGSGGSGSGGKSTQTAGSGGSEKGGNGGQSRTGGRQGSGGRVGTGGSTQAGTGGRFGRGTGGSIAIGGRTGTGGRFGGGTGGRGSGTGGRFGGLGGAPGTGGRVGLDAGPAEPCTPSKTITAASGSGTTGSFETTGAYCFRTPDNINGWGCSNFTGRTLKVNGVTVECAKLPLPAKVNGYYYFDASAGSVDYSSIYWY